MDPTLKQMMLDEYVDKFGQPDGKPDKLTIYILSCMLIEPTAVITKTRFWSTVEGGSDYIRDTNILFAFGSEGHSILLEHAENVGESYCSCLQYELVGLASCTLCSHT